ncbi:putative ribonuclease H-like domain-containing protein [Tanacetum coccineum]
MSFDDLYSNFKIVEQDVKGTASSSSSSHSQNMDFVSSPSSTNEVNTAYRVSTANTQVSSASTQVSPASTQVSTASTQVSTANLSDDTVYAFLASQPNGYQLVYEDLEQIHEDDIEEMDLKWQLALLSMRTKRYFQKTSRKITINGSDTAGYDKSKVECFNCHKMGHFARECRGPRNQDIRNKNQDSSRRTVKVEETSSKAMVPINGAGLFSPPNLDLTYSGLEEFQQPEFEGYGPKPSKSVSEDISNEAHCNYHQRERVVFGNNYTMVNYNYSAKKTHPSAHRNMVPRAVLIKTGLRSLNTARLVNTAHPKTTVYSARPMSHFSKSAQSTEKRPYQITTLTNKNSSQKVNTAKGKFNTARTNSAVVNAVRANQVNAVKASACWVWRPTKLNSASITLKRHNYGHPQKEDQGYVDSGCSRHMTGNMSYLSDFKEFDGGYVTFGGGAKGGKITGKGTLKTGKLDFEDVYFVKELQFNLFSVSQMCDKKNSVLFTDTGCFVLSPDFKLADESQVLLKVPRKNNMYSVDMKNIVPKESLTCLVAKATLDESMLWHRRLGHGKQHKASCKFKIQNSITQPLFMLHMDLFGPTFVSSLMNKKYCLVVTDDYSRFTWVFFLASKDETSAILKRFITKIDNHVDKKIIDYQLTMKHSSKIGVKSEFYEKKGIKKEFSVARNPQQNGVAERRNRTLIEAARTMVLVIKPHNKTPYELFKGRTSTLSFMRPFECHVTILNTLDYLSKFDGKSDEGFFVGYLLNNKAFRVYNIRTRKVEENLHIRFIEDKPIIVGDGTKWLFYIDVLTKLMNYVPVVAGTNSNDLVDGSLFDSSSKNDSNDEPQPSSDAGKKDDEGVNKESGINDQKRPENSSQDVNTAGPSINTASTNINTGSLNINTVSPTVTTAPLEATHADFFGDETEIDMSHITTTYLVPSTPNTRIHKDHSLDHVIVDKQSGVQTRRMTKTSNEQGFISAVYEGKTHEDLHTYLFACFLSQEEPKKVIQALKDPSWVEAMQEELLQFKLQQVWTLVDLPHGKRATGTEWVYMNKKDEIGAFPYSKIEEEVYVSQPLGFEDLDFPDRVYKTASTPMETSKPLMKDENAKDVDVHLYRLMIGSLMYLTSSRPDIMFADSPFDLEAYTDSDYAGASLDTKSIIRGCQFLGSRLISCQCKKQTIVATLLLKQNMWLLLVAVDKDSNEKKLIQMIKIHTDQNVADLLTKAFDVGRFQYLIASIGMLNL